MATQSNWRFCQKCHVMFFAGYAGGRCPAGGSHSAQGFNFALPYGMAANATAQDNWRFCQQCNAMFWAGYGGGSCPCGGAHSQQGFNFILTHDTAGGPSSQSNWKFCQKCNALFFNGYNGGTCPKGGRHAAQGFDFVLPYNADAAAQSGATTAAQLVWNGVRLAALPNDAIAAFADGLVTGAGRRLQSDTIWANKLAATIKDDPLGFQWGYSIGVLTGLFKGLKNLLETVVDLFKLAVEAAPVVVTLTNPLVALGRLAAEGALLLTDRAERELRTKQFHEAQAIAKAVRFALEDIVRNPDSYVDLGSQVGVQLGAMAAVWFTDDFLAKPAKELGEAIGIIVGMVLFEILLEIIIALATGGAGNAAKAGMAAGQGARGASRLSGLIEALRPILRRSRALERIVAKIEELLGAARIVRKLVTISEKDLEVIRAIRAANPELMSLTDHEIFAIRAYTDMGFVEINAGLRGVKTATPEVAEQTADLLSAMKKLPGFSGDLTRSEGRQVIDAAAEYVEGTIFTPKGMLSTSRGGAVASREGNVGITVKAIGKSGKDITKMAVHAKSEAEILFLPGTRFRVESAKQIGMAFLVVLREL